MKTITNGHIPTPWYVGLQATCSHCGGTVEFDTNDQHLVQTSSGYQDEGDQYINIPCPTLYCTKRIYVGANASELWRR